MKPQLLLAYLLAALVACTAMPPRQALAQSASLVKDITTSTPSRPEHLTARGSEVFFVADDGIHGRELWASDGTREGTRLVKDLLSGIVGSNPRELKGVAGRLFFIADADVATTGSELWVSDGTEARTRMLRDFNLSAAGSYGYAEVNGELYFSLSVWDGQSWKSQIWKSDGTPEGTMLIKEIGRIPPSHLTNVDGTLSFMVATELWKSDGTPEGTVLVAEPYRGPNPPTLSWLAGMGGRLFFYYASAGLWTSDGTAEGTVLLKDTGPNSFNALGGRPTVANGKLFFSTNCLWTSDGTSEGTLPLQDRGTCPLFPPKLTSMNGKVYFKWAAEGRGYELWVSDGTPEGTVLVKDINPGTLDSSPTNLTVWNGKLYFTADDGAHGDELWTSDGTLEGTFMVQDLMPGLQESWIEDLAAAEGALYFSGDDGVHGMELWSTDGTIGGASLVEDINVSETSPSQLFHLTAFEGNLFFGAAGGTPFSSLGPGRLWRTDGSEEGTVPIADMEMGTFLQGVNGHLIFFRYEPATGEALWTSEGTPEDTKLLKVVPGRLGCDGTRSYACTVRDRLFFRFSPCEVWTTDGTEAGTIPFRDFLGLPEDLNLIAASCPVELDGRLFFRVGDDLWASDGTPEGTGIFLEAYAAFPPLTSAGGKLFFRRGSKLWVTDGSFDGTFELMELGFEGVNWLGEFTEVAGEVFFMVCGNKFGTDQVCQIWRTDGTPDGTSVVRESNLASGLTNLGGKLFFFDADGNTGYEPWLSDGTEAGTSLIKDLHPGPGSSISIDYAPVSTVFEGRLLFAADDGSSGEELWESDGTAEGTFLVQDINHGAGSSSPRGFTFVGRTVFFTADDGTHGTELWKLPIGEKSLFHRGDPNSSGGIDISDGIAIFGHLFLGNPTALSCKESADANNDGRIDISDGIYLLNWLFVGGPEPSAPGPTALPCGFDPDSRGSPGDLGCEGYGACNN